VASWLAVSWDVPLSGLLTGGNSPPMLNHDLAWFDGEHYDALYQTSAFLLQDSVGHRNRPLNHFGSFVSWMPGYHGGRCSRPFKSHRPQSSTTDKTCPYFAESVFCIIADPFSPQAIDFSWFVFLFRDIYFPKGADIDESKTF
jgi:hypothetical protein